MRANPVCSDGQPKAPPAVCRLDRHAPASRLPTHSNEQAAFCRIIVAKPKGSGQCVKTAPNLFTEHRAQAPRPIHTRRACSHRSLTPPSSLTSITINPPTPLTCRHPTLLPAPPSPTTTHPLLARISADTWAMRIQYHPISGEPVLPTTITSSLPTPRAQQHRIAERTRWRAWRRGSCVRAAQRTASPGGVTHIR